MLNRIHGTKHTSKKINGKVVCAEYKLSDKGNNNCYLVCQFNEGGNDVERSIPVGQVNLGHVKINLRSNPLYHPAAAAAAAVIAPLLRVSDTPLKTQEMPPPAPAAAETPAAANITGGSFASDGGNYFASPTNNIDALSINPAPFKLPAEYVSRIPAGCISTKTREHGGAFFKAKNGQLWYKPPPNTPIYIDDGAQKVQWSVKDQTGIKYSP